MGRELHSWEAVLSTQMESTARPSLQKARVRRSLIQLCREKGRPVPRARTAGIVRLVSQETWCDVRF